MISPTPGTISYFRGEVVYTGRAEAKLTTGNYLLLIKDDGAVTIHASTLIQPRNFLGTHCVSHVDGDHIHFARNNEKLSIKIDKVHWTHQLTDWSDTDVQLEHTEAQLVDKLVDNIGEYISDVAVIQREYATPLGKIDLFITDIAGYWHIIEVKRRRGTLRDCYQLQRYMDAIGRDKMNVGYLASPSIGQNAADHLAKLGYRWLQIDW